MPLRPGKIWAERSRLDPLLEPRQTELDLSDSWLMNALVWMEDGDS